MTATNCDVVTRAAARRSIFTGRHPSPLPPFLQNTSFKRLSSAFCAISQFCTQYVVFRKFEVPTSCLLLLSNYPDFCIPGNFPGLQQPRVVDTSKEVSNAYIPASTHTSLL